MGQKFSNILETWGTTQQLRTREGEEILWSLICRARLIFFKCTSLGACPRNLIRAKFLQTPRDVIKFTFLIPQEMFLVALTALWPTTTLWCMSYQIWQRCTYICVTFRWFTVWSNSVSAHRLSQYYQPLRVPNAVRTDFVTWYTSSEGAPY